MKFLKLSFTNFRNIKIKEINVEAPEVFFVGKNGQGKTNFLEAVYLLCYGTSFRTKMDRRLINKDSQQCNIKGWLKDEDGIVRERAIKFDSGAKKEIILDSKKVEDRKELLKDMPCILFSHEDMAFVKGTPEKKRWFMDQTLSLFNAQYIDLLRNYHLVLKNRNEILKNREMELIEVYNKSLALHGLNIMKSRISLIEEFNSIFSDFCGIIADLDSEIKISYRPSWNGLADEKDVLDRLESGIKRDVDFGLTTTGPHRDLFYFILNGDDFIKIASTGQIRLLSIALRVAQAIYYHKKTGKQPLFLMDDVLLELDQGKRDRCIQHLPEYSQIFFTFLPNENYGNYKKKDTRIYFVQDGVFTEGN
jgi:DNA replication and repair protein RecF